MLVCPSSYTIGVGTTYRLLSLQSLDISTPREATSGANEAYCCIVLKSGVCPSHLERWFSTFECLGGSLDYRIRISEGTAGDLSCSQRYSFETSMDCCPCSFTKFKEVSDMKPAEASGPSQNVEQNTHFHSTRACLIQRTRCVARSSHVQWQWWTVALWIITQT